MAFRELARAAEIRHDSTEQPDERPPLSGLNPLEYGLQEADNQTPETKKGAAGISPRSP
jgi:hypothetical protein